MPRVLAVAFSVLLTVLAIGYAVRDAWAWQRAADIVDSGFRKMATTGTATDRPGAIYLESDSYYWLSYARRVGNGETWRIRETHNDNTPHGRPVHWSQSITWLLVLFGKIRQWTGGEPWATAMERASVWINPFLEILLLAVLCRPLVRRVGAVPFGLFAAYLVTLGDVGWEFQALRPDHQSLQALFGILSLAGLVLGGAGWIRTSIATGKSESWMAARPLEVPDYAEARRWFLLSACSVALSVWVSAVVTLMLLGMLFGASVLMAFCAPKLDAGDEIEVRPELWQTWGRVAALGSFVMYLVEYFPNHLEFRLEINGPIYSLTLFGLGEAVNHFLRARYGSSPGSSRTALIKGLGFSLLVALVPVAILLGPASWHALKDPEMRRLHDFIQEFYSMPRFAGPRLMTIILQDFGFLPLVFLLAVGLAAFTELRLVEWAVVWLSFVVALGMLGLGYMQVRWLGLYAAMNAWMALVTGVCAWRLLKERLPRNLRWITGCLLGLLLLIQPIQFAWRGIRQVNDIIAQRTIPKELANPVMNKRLALALRQVEGAGTRVMADPDFVPALEYFGDGQGVVAFYWEDMDGLHDAVRFFADSDGNVARQVATKRGLTHVVVQEGNRLQTYFYYLATGNIDQEAAKQIFAARLMGSEFELPSWLQTTPALGQIGQQIYTYGGMKFEDRWRIYRVTP